MDFSPLLNSISFNTASLAVLAGFVLLAGFGLVVRGGLTVLNQLGLNARASYISRLSPEEFKTLSREIDIQERRRRRREYRRYLRRKGFF